MPETEGDLLALVRDIRDAAVADARELVHAPALGGKPDEAEKELSDEVVLPDPYAMTSIGLPAWTSTSCHGIVPQSAFVV